MRSFILLVELPHGPSHVLQACLENSKQLTGYNAILNVAGFLLIGKRVEAMDASEELHGHREQLMGLNREHYLRIIDYCREALPEEELLKAEIGSRWNQCEAHFYVALGRLSQGDRIGAREHFQKAFATRVLHFGEYQLSELFLKRTEQEPNWPPWIPLQEPGTQPATTVER